MILAAAILLLQDDVERYLDGLRAIEEGRPQVALDHARTVLMQDRGRADFWELAGRAYWASGMPREAEAPIERALELDPAHLGALWVRAHVRDAAAAVEDFTRILGLTRDRGPALRGRARAWLALGLTDLAAADAQAAQDEEEKKQRAAIQKEIDRITACIEDDPRSAKLYLQRAEKRLIIGDGPGAARDAARGAELEPKSAEAYVLLARAHALSNAWENAVEAASKAIELEPSAPAHWLQRAGYQLTGGKHKAALADCDRALALDPKALAAWMQRGRVRIVMQDLDGALQDYTEVIRINPRAAPAYVQRAAVRNQKGDPSGAIEDYARAIEIDPASVDAYLGRSASHEKLEKWREALADMDRALEIMPALAKTPHFKSRREGLKKKIEE